MHTVTYCKQKVTSVEVGAYVAFPQVLFLKYMKAVWGEESKSQNFLTVLC